MDVRLDGKVALVTGASKGIGRAIAAAFAASGAQVMLSSRKTGRARRGRGHHGRRGRDVCRQRRRTGAGRRRACRRRWIRSAAVDILVNNAATNPYMGPSIDIDLGRYDKTLQVNLRGPLVWTQLVWNASMREHGGAVINIASVGAMGIEPRIGIYNTTKAALDVSHAHAGRGARACRAGQRHRCRGW